MPATVCAVVEAGGAPGRNPLLGPLRERLARDGVRLVEWDPTRGVDVPPAAPAADLYLLKADEEACLSAAGCLSDSGAPCLNTFEATAAAHDKARTLARLSLAGLPVPATRLVADRAELDTTLAAGPKFVKPVRGAHGTGAALLGPSDTTPAAAGPWLVQEVVGGAGWSSVVKVYGVGSRVAVRRMQFAPGVLDAPRRPVGRPDPFLVRTAVTAAEVCGLICFGADFVVGDDGPVLVDLNSFPGYRSVPEAPEWIADAVATACNGGWAR